MKTQDLQNQIAKLSSKVFPNNPKPNIPLDQYGDEFFILLDKASRDGFTFKDVFNATIKLKEERRNAVMNDDNVQMEFKV